MKILVLGASGLLGANFTMSAINRGHTLVATYLTHPVEFPDTPSLGVDLTNSKEVQLIIDKIRPDWVVNCAAETNLDYCEENPDNAFKKNVLIPRNIVKAVSKWGIKVAQISTDNVFPGVLGYYGEDSIINPINEYGRTKYLGEQAVKGNCDYLLIRTTFYGMNIQNKLSMAEWMLKNFQQGIEFTGFSNVMGSFIDAASLSDVILDLMSKDCIGIFHVGSHDFMAKYGFGLELAKVFKLDSSKMKRGYIEDVNLRAKRPSNLSLNVSKVETFLRRDMPTIRAGLERFKLLRETRFLDEVRIRE